ncbi:MAG: DNA-binding NarL/FixJ family response regulator [Actinomycetes bacterium]|jgi:DNA-binding NarL/FixJ family response regulator
MTTVLVCDDAPMAREAVRRALSGLPGVERVTAAGSGEEALARYPLERPDLILMDVRMPGIGGVEATKRLISSHPDAAVVMLTMGEDADGVARAVTGGARGYIAKDASREELASTMTLVLSTGMDMPGRTRLRPSGTPPALTQREQQVLEGMSRGLSNAGIGKELFLSEDTVKTHARRLFRKVGAADRAQAVALGFRWGFLH